MMNVDWSCFSRIVADLWKNYPDLCFHAEHVLDGMTEQDVRDAALFGLIQYGRLFVAARDALESFLCKSSALADDK